jgi:hypothetical protein
MDALLSGVSCSEEDCDEDDDSDAEGSGGEDDDGSPQASLPRRRPPAAGADAAATTAALLSGLASQLPRALGRLPRRRCAFLAECLAPVAGAARLVGGLLQRQSGAAGAAAQWRPFVGFCCNANGEVVAVEEDEQVAAAARRRLAGTALQLLAHLTLGWVPPGSAGAGDSSSGGAAGGKEAAAADGDESSSAAAELERLLRLLGDLGLRSWEDLEAASAAGGGGGAAAAGAALAALYSLLLSGGLEPPADGVTTLQAACRLARGLAEESQRRGSAPGLDQALKLLLLGAQRAATAPAAAPAPAADNAEAVTADVGPALSMLAAVMLQAPPASAPGRLSRQAWQALLEALQPPRLRLAALDCLLKSQHPEVCALLLARARQDAAGGSFGAGECWGLCAPWLRPDGPRGWRAAGVAGGGDALETNANAICAALNAVRLLLLRRQQVEGPAVAGSSAGTQPPPTSSAAAGVGSSSSSTVSAQLPSPAELRQAVLQPLQQAVRVALARLHAEAGGEHGGGTGAKGAEAEAVAAGGESARVLAGAPVIGAVPGEGQGTGSAVDAWLALSRVDDVLARVAELCM